MSETLSQEEIDKLLKAFSTGELDADDYTAEKEKEVKVYDFARPSKFSKEHLRTLENIFEHYGRLLYTNLPAYLRKNVQVDVMNAEALAYSEFSNALSNPVLLGIVNFAPLRGNVIMELGTNLGYAIIDRMLGGEGEAIERKRDFTEIEIIIIERILNICVDLLREPWQNVVNLHPRLERIETNPQFAQLISPTEMIAIVTISITIGEINGLMNVCLPFITLEDVMDKLNIKYWFSSMEKKNEESYEEAIEILIQRSEIPIRAILGHSTISVNDFANIQKGDIIKLDTTINNELDVYVGDIKKFKALPGTTNDDYAVRVTSIVRED
ncbi:MAG: flagellar motor switch protein FliM [Lachnospiraceae bacterium]